MIHFEIFLNKSLALIHPDSNLGPTNQSAQTPIFFLGSQKLLILKGLVLEEKFQPWF